MSAEALYDVWFVWLAIGGVLVAVAAMLLIAIIAIAHRIAVLAATARTIVAEIERSTRPIWQLAATNRVAGELLRGAHAIRSNAETVASALSERHR